MSKDTFSDKRLRKHSSVCTNSKIEKKKKRCSTESHGGSQIYAALNLAQRGFRLQLLVVKADSSGAKVLRVSQWPDAQP